MAVTSDDKYLCCSSYLSIKIFSTESKSLLFSLSLAGYTLIVGKGNKLYTKAIGDSLKKIIVSDELNTEEVQTIPVE